jgi:expansin (peptidoglycan-binding protein)
LSGGGAGCSDADPDHHGSATYYTLLTPTNVGTCGFAPLPMQPPYWVAMNEARFNNSTDCGACVQATGPSGTKVFMVVDKCPADSLHCDSMEHIDMDQTGFLAIGGSGMIPSPGLTWKYVSCPVQGNVQLFIPSTASKFNAPITVRNHRYRIKTVEVVSGNMRIAVTRQPYNTWVLDSTFPPGSTGMTLSPFRVRITDIYGHWIENKVTLVAGQSVDTGLQFPACPAGGDGGT